MKLKSWLALGSFFLVLASHAAAAVIGFEGVVPVGGSMNVGPTDPYSEAGFTLTPTLYASAVFDPAAGGPTLPGDATAWFGFQGGQPGGPFQNLVTLTGPSQFDLASFLAGRSPLAVISAIDLSVTGYVFGGGTLTATFSGLTTATLETLNWTNLTSVVFAASGDAGLDDISVQPSVIVVSGAPEPATVLLLGLGLTAVRVCRRN